MKILIYPVHREGIPVRSSRTFLTTAEQWDRLATETNRGWAYRLVMYIFQPNWPLQWMGSKQQKKTPQIQRVIKDAMKAYGHKGVPEFVNLPRLEDSVEMLISDGWRLRVTSHEGNTIHYIIESN
jgi:hypothetical protein